MSKYLCELLLATIIIICGVDCAPAGKDTDKNQTQNSVYDHNKFDEVYDQRQTGLENYKVNLDGVAMMYVSPESLLSVLGPLLLDGGDVDILEEIMKPIKPDRPSSSTSTSTSTTTSLPNVMEGNNIGLGSKNNALGGHAELSEDAVIKRRYRFPGFIRPLLSPTSYTKKKSVADV